MKNLVFLNTFLLVFSLLSNGQETKTIALNADKRVIALALRGDTIIAGGEFDSPYPHVAGANVATGEIFSLGSGIPDTVNNLFFVPWIKDVLFAATENAPYLFSYDFSVPSSDWIADMYFGITSKINDVDTISSQIVISTNEGTLLVNESGVSHLFKADPGYIAQCVSFNQTSKDGTFYVNERTGTSIQDYLSKLYKISADGAEDEKVEVGMGYVTMLFYMTDLDWYENKLMLLGGVATVPDNGIHTELITLSPTSENWTSFTHGNDCPGVNEMSVSGENIFVTGIFTGIDNSPEAGPTLASYDGNEWSDPFPSTSGVGYAIKTEPNGQWTVASGFLTQTEPSWFSQLLVFGTEIPEFTTGIEVPSSNFEVSVFPNPASDQIQVTGPTNTSVAIYNLMGQILVSGITNTPIKTDFPAGQYFARVSVGEIIVTRLFIVQH